MKNLSSLLFLSVFFLSCSHRETRGDLTLRAPSSQAVLGSCLESAGPLVESTVVPKAYKTSDFPKIFDSEMTFDAEILSVVESNSAPELQEQSLVIFGLLKKLHPEEGTVELIARYKSHFSYCP